MLIFGYALTILMGLTLGIVGAGGSIITVPTLVYFFNLEPITATTYSLLVVGITALFGCLSYFKKKEIDLKILAEFVIPASISVVLTRSLIIPNISEKIFGIPSQNLILVIFSFMMIFAAISSLKTQKSQSLNQAKSSYFKKSFGSFSVGFLTALVGAGGGFLIVPTLVKIFQIEVKKAVGTSLTIIAINSIIGFKTSAIFSQKIDWVLLSTIVITTITGIILGKKFSQNLNETQLKKFFAYFVLFAAALILTDQLKQITQI